ncbi:MAG: L-fucose:H+ symporter permease [Bacteroidota bacterium]
MDSLNNAKTFKSIQAFIFLVGLFLLWGVASNLNLILLPDFNYIFKLNSLQLGLIQVVFYVGYFVAALPASWVMNTYDFKAGIIIGLLLYGVGSFLFFPATDLLLFNLFILALFIIAAGLSFLETASNPFVLSLGSPKRAIMRLNIAQSFNPIGFFFSIMISQVFANYFGPVSVELIQENPSVTEDVFLTSASHSVLMPYLIVGIIAIIWALLIFLIKFPINEDDNERKLASSKPLQLIKSQSLLRNAILAQFFYMGAQVGIWNFIPDYALELGLGSSPINNYLIFSFVIFMIGRFASSFLMFFFPAHKLLAIYAILSVLTLGLAIILGGYSALMLVVALNFFMSLMFPTIFGLGLSGIRQAMKTGSALIVMGMIGGAILASLMKQISNYTTSLLPTLFVPTIGFLVVFWFAYHAKNEDHYSMR